MVQRSSHQPSLSRFPRLVDAQLKSTAIQPRVDLPPRDSSCTCQGEPWGAIPGSIHTGANVACTALAGPIRPIGAGGLLLRRHGTWRSAWDMALSRHPTGPRGTPQSSLPRESSDARFAHGFAACSAAAERPLWKKMLRGKACTSGTRRPAEGGEGASHVRSSAAGEWSLGGGARLRRREGGCIQKSEWQGKGKMRHLRLARGVACANRVETVELQVLHE